MSKPIAVIYVPESAFGKNGATVRMSDCMGIMEKFEKEKPDYHWFCFIDYDAPKIELKVFYEKDFSEIQYEELKKLITDAIEQQKQQTV